MHFVTTVQLNTAFKRRWFVLSRKSATLTYSKEPGPGGSVQGSLAIAGADISMVKAKDGTPELHVKCEGDSRIYILQGDRLDQWERALVKLA